jgi:hypothetical protein
MDTTSRRTSRRGIAVDPEGFRASERIAAYEIANSLLTVNIRLQTALGLRPEELEIFLIIVLATVQRYVRSTDPDPSFLDRTALPPHLAGFTSRRRIADVSGVPLETVRRHVARLMDRNLIVERGRGRLSTPGGTLSRLGREPINGFPCDDCCDSLLESGGEDDRQA